MRKLKNTLYILTENSDLLLENENIIVLVGGEERIPIPSNVIESIVCFANVTITTPLMGFLTEKGISTIFLSPYGKMYARLQGPISGSVLLRRQQYQTIDNPERYLPIVRAIISGKLKNSRRTIQRLDLIRQADEKVYAETLAKLASIEKAVKDETDMETLRGLEGFGAKTYFSAFPYAFQNRSFFFSVRTRRPPLDEGNALISFLYTLLKNDCEAALEAVGLDPQAGYLHVLRPGRPALALDLMEELRAPLCDRLAIAMVNRKQVDEQGFRRENGGVYLNADGRKKAITAWQKRKKEKVLHPELQEEIPIGLIPYVQAQCLAKTIRGQQERYIPFLWR